MTLPRRLQLMKLLSARGVRGVERARDEDLKRALAVLHLVPAPVYAADPAPSSGALGRRNDAVPAPPDEDDPHALPRFREPRVSLPDQERTFLRAIAQKPRVCFFTWDVARARRRGNSARLELRSAPYLGDPPDADALARAAPSLVVDVDLGAAGWYVPVPSERLALLGRLVDDAGVIATSNVTLTPPARPAPPGPLWIATLPPSLDRRSLRTRSLLDGEVPEAQLARVGESDARLLGEDGPTSGMFRLWGAASSGALPSSSSSSARAAAGKDEP